MVTQELLVKQTTIALAVFLGLIGLGAADIPATSPTATSVQHVNAAQAQKLVADKKVVVLDLRTPEEFKGGHIAGATNIDFLGTDFEQRLAAFDNRTTYLIHCASGNRSTQALPLFKQLKFQSLYHLDGGFRSWVKAGLPVKK
jgi:rhodanese-related sulfurtransferase